MIVVAALLFPQAYIYDIRSCTYLHKLQRHSDAALNVAFNPAKPERADRAEGGSRPRQEPPRPSFNVRSSGERCAGVSLRSVHHGPACLPPQVAYFSPHAISIQNQHSFHSLSPTQALSGITEFKPSQVQAGRFAPLCRECYLRADEGCG
ncbi:hypothetical protein SKAU_G00162980 [Synaphobranchus kaupii]|uniref:Uncharacterized protein n=1 Tax=Synaphobranchus kaupii TaxID=118154 RepID=A0A9Q1FJ26_SYNKA|nr:hypothetical protein SKAU_G00162980 [Synaphobranchus kaupii]